ncbi:MAG: restriction endonuclease subunit S [Clostridiales bacterium]|nr:restriction endonuclease subunit S [Clostridiales bacterium]
MKKAREGYKMTELGEIPEDWEVNSLKDDIELISGQHVCASDYSEEKIGIGYLTGPIDFPNGKIHRTKYTDKPKAMCEKNDILITVKGSGAGKVIISDDQYCISRQLMAIRTNKWNYKYIFYFLQSMQDNYNESAVGLIPGITREDINNSLVAIPTLIEQQKIASILSTVDEHIEETESLIEKAKELKKGLMQRLLTKGIGHTKFKKTEVGEIPVEWKVKRAGEVFYTVTDYVANGSFASLKENVNYRDEEDYAILIRLTDYNNNFQGPFIYIDKKGYNFLNKSCLEPGDIIIANVGAYAGFPFRIPNINKPMTLGPNAILVRSNENKDYIFYWLQSRFGQESLKDIISITAQPKFNKTDFKTLLIPIPSYKEQQKLALILLLIDEKISQYESQKENLKRLKNGLMQKLLTGKIRVKV